MHLRLIPHDTERSRRLSRTAALCGTLIEMRAPELRADLAFYSGRLRALAALDPLDRTGLAGLYRMHARHLRRLLAHPATAED